MKSTTSATNTTSMTPIKPGTMNKVTATKAVVTALNDIARNAVNKTFILRKVQKFCNSSILRE